MIKNGIKKIMNSRAALWTGLSIVNYDLLQYMKHHLWVPAHRKVPLLKIAFMAPRDVAPEDVALCQRLIEAFRRALAEKVRIENDTSALWSGSLQKHCAKLAGLLAAGNARDLAVAMAGMFREDFVYGLASGSLVSHARSRIGAKIWSMKYQDNVVALGEYLGVVRNESTQQGIKAHGLKEGMDVLVAKIEAAIGMSIGFPDIGAPYGIMANGRLITMEHPEHLYVALRVAEAWRDHGKGGVDQPLDCVEIGAGFGGLAYWMLQAKKLRIGSYSIIDLPLINVIQGYFLGKALGPSAVRFYGEAGGPDARVAVLPTFAFEAGAHGDVDVLINENSMPEMSDAIVENYICQARRRLRGIFFSYNHEAYSIVHGSPQVWVPEIVSRVGGFRRLSRVPSWLRSGYVEEVYQKEGGA